MGIFLPFPMPPKRSLLNNLGAFFGGIWHGIRTDPSKPARREVRREVEHETRDTPQGRVTIRRTTIEEVELPPAANRTQHPES